MLAAGLLCIGIDIFVSTTGDDAQSGTSSTAPVRTLARARDLVRSLRNQSSGTERATVHMQPGTYGLRSALVLDSALDANTTWATTANDAGHKATISGGVLLDGGAWNFNESAAAWQTHLPSLPFPPTDVFWSGTRLGRARSRVLTAAGRVPGGVWGLTFAPGDIPEAWETSHTSLMKWRLIVHNSWNVGHHTVARVVRANSTIMFGEAAAQPIDAGQRYWIEGVDELW